MLKWYHKFARQMLENWTTNIAFSSSTFTHLIGIWLSTHISYHTTEATQVMQKYIE